MTLNDYIKVCKKWEGGLSKDKDDSASAYPCPTPYKGQTGWHTNKGITYGSWVSIFGKTNDARFFAMSDEDWFTIFDKNYFSKVKGHEFKTLNIAAMVTAIAWGSGVVQGGKHLQRALNIMGAKLEVDGIIGQKTLKAANTADQRQLFNTLLEVREQFFRAIAKGKNAKFLNGWLNRLRDYKQQFQIK
ncbi:MAG TPA: putative peptidoglycan-binding domain-containing protein [Crocinitomicaceae bacterium]|nr:putative peptidoglycan-binding domain-containing protein [Crocinitomicaceae bacterium]